MNDDVRQIKSHFQAIMLIFAVIVCAYGSSLFNGFVWDDYLNIVDNQFIKSFENLPLLFSREYLTSSSELPYLTQRNVGAGELSYRPIVTLTYFLDFALWGLNPFGYHLTNFLLHFLNSFLVYSLALAINHSNRRFALITSLIFAIHPVQTEAVLTVSFREDLLAGFFILSSFMLYLRAQTNTRQWPVYLLSALCYALALFSKEMAIAFPFLLILYENCFSYEKKLRQGNMTRRYYYGLGVVTFFYLWIWGFIIPRVTETPISYPGHSFYLNILTMLKVFALYITLFLMPVNIHPTLPDESIFATTFWDPVVIISFVVIAACLWLAYACRKKCPIITFATMWVFAALLPVANIIPIENIMAARYLYIPVLGFCLTCAFGWEQGLNKSFNFFSPTLSRIFAVGILLFYILLTLTQSFYWTNEISFRKTFLQHYPANVRAYRSLAGAYARFDRYEEAIVYMKKAKALAPMMPEIYLDLANLYWEAGKKDLAEREARNIKKVP